MNNKAVIASYAFIGAAVATSLIYNKMLERDAKRFTAKMRKNELRLVHDITTLAK